MRRYDINVPLHYLLWPWRHNPFLKWVSDRIRLDKAAFFVIVLAMLGFIAEASYIVERSFSGSRYYTMYYHDELESFALMRLLLYNAFWWAILPALVTYRASAWVRDRRFTPLLLTDLTSRELGQLLLASDVLGLTIIALLQAIGIIGLGTLLDYRLKESLLLLTVLQFVINVITIHAHAWMVLTFTTESRFFPRILWYTFCFIFVECLWLGLLAFLVFGGREILRSVYDWGPSWDLSENSFLWTLAVYGAAVLLTKHAVAHVYRAKFCQRIEENPDCYPG